MRLSSALFILSSTLLLSLANAQNEPVRGYITLEPFELRVEALCNPIAFADEWNIQGDTLKSTQKDRVLELALNAMRTKTAVASTGHNFSFDSTQSRFVRLTPDLGYVPDERDAIPLAEAIVGVSLSSLCRDVDELRISWTWLAPKQWKVPIQLSAGEELLGRFLNEARSSMKWRRSPDNHYSPKLLPLSPVVYTKRNNRSLLLKIGLGILGLTGLIIIIMKNKTPPLVFFLIPLALIALMGAFRFSKSVAEIPNKRDANDLVYSLLRNTYHAFDYRDESDIYDLLEKSISGPLLESVYLEVRKALELEFKGGPRVRIDGVHVRTCEILARNDDSGTFDINAEWTAVGNVNHWGHTHLRTNRYNANIRISSFDDIWKISKMQVLDEERTQQVSRTDAAE